MVHTTDIRVYSSIYRQHKQEFLIHLNDEGKDIYTTVVLIILTRDYNNIAIV